MSDLPVLLTDRLGKAIYIFINNPTKVQWKCL